MTAYKQLRKPNVKIKTIGIGWCLWWVQEAFSASHLYPTAIAEWEKNTYNHTGTPPKGLWVPVFFRMRGVPAGHVAIWAPDGSIYSTSSPYSLVPVHHKNLADLNRYYGGKLTYLGWSEDIGGVRVVQPIPVVKKSIEAIAKEVIQGKWGNGLIRIAKLKKAGYDPKTVQIIVNKLLK